MRNFVIAAVALLFAGSVALAQSQSDNSSTAPGTHEVSVTGCLGGGPGHYTILTREGKTIEVQTKNPDVDKLIGHTVEATGTETPGAMSSKSDSTSFPNGKNTGSDAVFSAGTLVDISPSCDQQSTKAKPKY